MEAKSFILLQWSRLADDEPFSIPVLTAIQVIRKKIPIRIKNVENPSGGGTVIHPDPDIDAPFGDSPERADSPITTRQQLTLGSVTPGAPASPTRSPTAVTIKDHIMVLNINSNRKTISHGFLARIFGILDRFGVTVDLISTSEVHVSMAIEAGIGKKNVEKLIKELRNSGTVGPSKSITRFPD